MKQTLMALKFTAFSLLTSLAVFSSTMAYAVTSTTSTATQKLVNTINLTPSDESLEKLLVIQHFDKIMDKTNQQSVTMVKSILESLNLTGDKQLTAQQNQQIKQLMQQFVEEIIKEQNTPAVRRQYRNAFMQVAKNTYTQQEVNALIDFYGSSMGQQIVNKQGQFSTDYMKAVLEISMQYQQEILNTKLPKFTKDIEKVLNKNQKNKK